MTTKMTTMMFAILASSIPACVAGQDSAGLADDGSGTESSAPDDALAQDSTASELSITPHAASTHSIVFTSGTRAAEAWYNRSGGDPACSGPCLALLDAKCDGHQVYVDYEIDGVHQKPFSNNGGCGSMNRRSLPGIYNIKYRVCVDIQLGSDVCDNFVFDHNP